MSDLSLNPVGDTLTLYGQIDDRLRNKADAYIENMNKISDQSKEIAELDNFIQAIISRITIDTNHIPENFEKEIADVFGVKATLDKKGLFSIDLAGSKWDKSIQKLCKDGKLATNNSRFENKGQLDRFHQELEQQKSLLKNETSKPMLLIQPLLNLIELFANMAKKCVELDEKLKEKANNIR
ncbi:MAG: hypothetical protein K940chlam1_00842 [Candidatus Anoxychlamydiales bacterium]|nr:hypothetical protein [Candidatus Anoxychlamydiales bacterium]NGX35970.1 hypothetical protein [Candidatus Anoxychlamydiales bacterium]